MARDEKVLAVAVKYRYLEEPPNPRWLRSMLRARLTRAQRKDERRVAEEEALVLRERRQLAERLADLCEVAPENWRWQAPLRALKAVLDEGHIGRLFRGRIHYCNSFPVFDNQPFLKQLDRFILTDIGSHILDTARFLFGEASQLYCQTCQVHPDIQGEDVATVMLKTSMGSP